MCYGFGFLYICSMKRHISAKLKKWKSSKNRKPLILKGARQVGKTWAMKDFGRSEFEQMVYVNFERDKLLQNLFKQDFDPERILLALQVSAGITIEPENTLIVLDEIQEVKGGLTALKYFNEEKPEYAIIAAGSLLGVSLAGGSFPVGKVEFLEMHPMTFSEFLMAMEENQLLDLIKSLNWDLIKTFKPKIVELLKQYYFTGGMPEAVKSFSREKNFRKVREIQENILNAYDNDFSKHNSPDLIPKISLLWHSLPAQLARENKKFVYGIVKKGARGRDYDKALNWLEQYGLTYRVERITKPGFPLKSYADLNAFKLFASDVGLLGALAGLDEKILLDGNAMFTEFKGALTEQYVLQQLISENEIKPFYWSHENSSGEIDFIFDYKNTFYPVEVKAETNLQAKSLINFHKKYQPEKSLRFSLADYSEKDWVTDIPLFALSELKELI